MESVLTQTGVSVRVLIIDDASPDNTTEVAESLVRDDSRVHFIKHTSNRGHISTFNEGIEWVSANYMILLSADDYLLPGALLRSAEMMDSNPSIGFIFGRVIALDEDGKKAVTVPSGFTKTRIISGLDFIKFSGARNIVLTPSVMVRTSLQKTLGGYLPALTHTGDMEMWLRFAAHGSVGFLNVDQAVYRRHPLNMSRGYSPESDLFQRRSAFEYFLSSCGPVLPDAPKLREWLMGQLACDAVRCASRAFNEGDMELSKRLLDYAVKLDPNAKQSLPWMLLTLKRIMGLRIWLFLQPTTDRMRQFIAQIRQRRSETKRSSGCARVM